MTWPTISVFVSSTFQDMQHERDVLRENVFPVIQERLRARRFHLEVVDLRWGIWTSDEAEQMERQMRVLSVCLDEIERCRPFFLALIGDRYGWTPSRKVMEDVAAERELKLREGLLSVTELEITAALDHSRGQCRPVVFMLEGASGSIELDNLREQLRTTLPKPAITYSRDRLDDFVTQAVDSLWSQIDPVASNDAGHTDSAGNTTDGAQLDDFVERHLYNFVGREPLLHVLLDIAREQTSAVIAIVGASGSGKSALFAQLVSQLPTNAERLVLAHSSSMGPDAAQIDVMLRRFVAELARSLDETNPLDASSTAEVIDSVFAELLTRASASRRTILLIDGLDDFESTPRATYLSWIPGNLGARTLIIATGRRCTATELIESHTRTPAWELAPLTQHEAAQLIQRVCEQYHRAMEEETLQMLLDKKSTDAQAAHGNPYWCHTATELLNLAGRKEFRSVAQYGGNTQAALRKLLQGMVQNLPGDPAEVVISLLAYLEETFGADRVRDFALTLRLGRLGWREQDLLGILNELGHQAWSALDVAQLRRGFRSQLRLLSQGGFWTYAHQLVRNAAWTRYGQDNASVIEASKAIVLYLRSLPREEPLRASQLTHHLIGTEQMGEVARYLASDLSDAELEGAVSSIADLIIHMEGRVDTPGDGAVQVLLVPAAGAGELIDSVLYVLRVGTHVDRALETRVPLATRQRLLEACLEFFSGPREILKEFEGFHLELAAIRHRLAAVLQESGKSAGAQSHLAASFDLAQRAVQQNPDDPRALGNLAQVYFLQGQTHFSRLETNIEEIVPCEESLQKALEIMERVIALVPDKPKHHSGVGAICSVMGQLYLQMGAPEMAAEYWERALAESRICVEIEPDGPWRQFDLASSLTAMGVLRMNQRRPDEALVYHQEALQIRDQAARRDPDNPQKLEPLAFSHFHMGKTLLVLSEVNRANDHLSEAVRITKILLDFDPGRQEWSALQESAQALMASPEISADSANDAT